MKKFYFLAICLVFYFGLTAQEDSTWNAGNSIPIVVLSETDFEDGSQSDDISDLLQSSLDVYTNKAGFNFGQVRYKIRGYDSRYNTVLLNGIHVNNAENGRPYYSNWGGLNDVTRYKVNNSGLSLSDYTFGGIGGVTNITLRPSQFRKSVSVSYAFTNQSYQHRVMATYNTGLMEDGWAFTASISARLAPKGTPIGYVEGAFYEGYSYYFSAEKKLSKNNSLTLTAFASPARIGKSTVCIQEAYDVTDNNFYNPSWGYLNGKIRNSKISNLHQPRFLLSHYWTINETSKLTTTASFVFGRNGQTALNWYDVADPRPEYYRNFPSYYQNDPNKANDLAYLWQNNAAYNQINWDSFYFANSKNLYTINNEGGVAGKNITGNRAKYIIEERRYDETRFDLNSNYQNNITDNLKINAGLNVMVNRTHNFKILTDLLGADFWLDIDQFAERENNEDQYIQNDIKNPNRAIKEGEIFGYNYFSNINTVNAYGQLEGKYKKIDFFTSVDLTYTNLWRSSNMTNGKFINNSGGKSPQQNFVDPSVKAGLTYKISGHHYILLNAAFIMNAPYFRDIYISPRTRDFLISDITGEKLRSEKIASSDLSYVMKYRLFSMKLTGFFTQFYDGVENNSFYHDELKTFVNYIMTNIDKRHFGGEFGFDIKASSTVTFSGALGYGQYLYSSRPHVTIAQDNSSEVLVNDKSVFIEYYHICGTPELAANLGIRYQNPNSWQIGADFNYFDEIYVNINPERRTAEAIANFMDSDPQINEILNQTKLNKIFTLNISGGKSWSIARKYNIGFLININNALHNKVFNKWFKTDALFANGVPMSGFEQYRVDYTNISKFPPKYTYMYGTTFFANIYFRF